MWRWTAVIFAPIVYFLSKNTIEYYVTGTSAFEVIVRDDIPYVLGIMVLAIVVIVALR